MSRYHVRVFARGLRLWAIVACLFVVFVGVLAPSAGTAHAASQATLDQYKAWMQDARAKYPYPQSLDKMWRVMMCESGGNANAVGPHGKVVGLLQYSRSTCRS